MVVVSWKADRAMVNQDAGVHVEATHGYRGTETVELARIGRVLTLNGAKLAAEI